MRVSSLSSACLLVIPGILAAESLPAAIPHLQIGSVDVRTLRDGVLSMKGAELLKGIDPADIHRMLGGKGTAMTPVNAFLVRMHGKNILVDTGMGKAPGGGLVEQLRRAGVDPAQIDLVLITHLHFDHIGGLLKADGTRAFPRAMVRVAKAEHDFWLGEPSKLSADLKARTPDLNAAIAPYQAAGAYRPFAADESLGRDIQAIPAGGHTGGHTIFAFGSKGHELWCIGDLIHFGAIQFERPTAGVVFDTDGPSAVRVRQTLFKRAAECQAVLAGAHLPELVRVKVAADGQGFSTTPAR
ncbi:MAG TPA: MBL fold metallo-hydrolase [Holophaga sp.]|nr:MBL fold metallo-hydrolase [Holophaga sp.]